jgi:hypothetical protein
MAIDPTMIFMTVAIVCLTIVLVVYMSRGLKATHKTEKTNTEFHITREK